MEDSQIQFPENINVKVENIEPLALRVAILLYTYGNFNEIQNNYDFANICIKRGNDFAKAYNDILNKNK